MVEHHVVRVAGHFEDPEKFEHLDVEAGLFLDLPRYCSTDVFTEFEAPARDRPQALARLVLASHHQEGAVFHDNGTDGDNGTGGDRHPRRLARMSEAVVDRVRAPWVPWALLAVGVLGASVSAIFVVYARDAEPMAISFWRCFSGAAVLLPFAGAGLKRMEPRQVWLPAVAGVLLAAHFATWITSLELTTIAASVLLVTSSPAFVALIAWWLLKERLAPVGLVGIVLTIVGAAFVVGGDLSGSRFTGNLLALAGAVAVGGYMLVGQVSRRELGIFEYSVITYSVAGIVLLPIALASGAPLSGYDAQTWWALAGLLVGPQLLGHTVLNFVLKDFGATVIAVAVMAEPLIAAFLAYLLFGEVPSLLIYPGAACILLGIYLVSTRRKAPGVVIE